MTEMGVSGEGVAGVGVSGEGVAGVGLAGGVGVALTLETQACPGWTVLVATARSPACPVTWPLLPPSGGGDRQRAGEQ